MDMKRNHAALPSRERTSREDRMKKVRAIGYAAVAPTTIFRGLGSAAASQPVPAGAVACNFIARGYVNATQGTAVGYFTGITGISGSLFNGSPSEKTAFFTFRHDVGSLKSPPPTNGDFRARGFDVFALWYYSAAERRG
jgi:hypothetical protein